MGFDLGPIELMCKAEVLEVLWVMTEVVAPSEVVKPVPPSELVLV